jgi:hypothetical protein
MGKSGGSSPPPVVLPPSPEPQDFGPLLEMMQAQMGAIAAMAAQQPVIPPIPEPTTIDTNIDWDAKRREELNKQRKTLVDEAQRRKGISSTVLTSPLLDDEDLDLLGIDLLKAS